MDLVEDFVRSVMSGNQYMRVSSLQSRFNLTLEDSSAHLLKIASNTPNEVEPVYTVFDRTSNTYKLTKCPDTQSSDESVTLFGLTHTTKTISPFSQGETRSLGRSYPHRNGIERSKIPVKTIDSNPNQSSNFLKRKCLDYYATPAKKYRASSPTSKTIQEEDGMVKTIRKITYYQID